MEFLFQNVRIEVNISDRSGLLTEVGSRLSRREGFALATINLDHLVKLGQSARFRAAYAQHSLIVADGNPIVWLSRLAGRPVSLVPGSDLLVPLAQIAAAQGVAVAVVGSIPAAVDGAVAHLRSMVPGLKLSARLSPEMGFDPQGAEALRLLNEVADSGARLCFVALGAPRQEEFAARGVQLLPGVGFVSIGAGIDFLSGHQKRAPAWMRRLALEWAYRLMTNPRRLMKRYAACAAILPRQIQAAWALRGQPLDKAALLVLDQSGAAPAQPVEPIAKNALGLGKFADHGEEGLLDPESAQEAQYLAWIDQQPDEPQRLNHTGGKQAGG